MDVGDYLTYCKVQPPFRSEADRMALVEGLARGAIDAVVSAHDPQPAEDKRLPIAEASYGAIGLETLLPALLRLVADNQVTLVQALKPVTSGPADLLGLPQGRLAIGAPADLVLFDPNAPWLCDRDLLLSRSKNSPFDGRRLEGKVLHTWVDGRTVFERK
jgi:dihydroorotase